MLTQHYNELVGLFHQFRDPDGIIGAASVLSDWLEAKGLADLARRIFVSSKFPDLEVELPCESRLPQGVRFAAKGGVPGTILPASMIGSYFAAYPHILKQSGHIRLTDAGSIPPASRLARDCRDLVGYSGALFLNAGGVDRVPWEVLLQIFNGVHTLEFIRCVLEHRSSLARKSPETFPALRNLKFQQCARMTFQGSHILAAPMFSRVNSLNLTTETGGGW